MLIDAHTHIAKYESNLDEAIREIHEHRILTISNSMDAFAFEKNLKIAERCALIMPIFGIHPWSATEYSYKLEKLVDYIDQSPMIGEIGLDHHFEDNSKYQHQNQVFEFFLEFARKTNKVINLHTKGAEREILNYLKKYDIKRSIIHWYSGPAKLVDQFLELGCYFTIGVEVLEGKKIRNLAKRLPMDRILTETDNPGAYKWLRDEPGMPSLIQMVVDSIADIRKISAEDTTESVKNNLAELLRDDEHISEYFKSLLNTNNGTI